MLIPNVNRRGRRGEDVSESIVDRRAERFENFQNERVSSFKNFMDCKPPTFKGGEDLLACMRWIKKMEQVFESGEFTSRQQVTFVVRMFEGEALDWRDSVSSAMTPDAQAALTWEGLVARMKARFCNVSAIKRNEREFLNLQKGDMKIGKYNTLFLKKTSICKKVMSRLVNVSSSLCGNVTRRLSS